MRVSDSMMKSLVLKNNAKGAKALYDASEPMMTGQKVNRPSDDPIQAQLIQRIDESLAKFKAFKTASTRVDLDLTTADSKLQTAQTILAQIKERAVQMANDTYNADDRAAAAAEIAGLQAQLLAIANSQQPDGRYLFGGVAEGQPAYDANGVYQGSLTNRQVEILPGLMVQATLTGPEAFGAGPSVFEQIQELIDALNANDLAGIQAGLGVLDDAIVNIGIAQANLGGQLNNLTQAQDTLADMEIQLLVERSIRQDPDLSVQITKLAQAEQSLSAVIEISKRLLNNTLLNWLR